MTRLTKAVDLAQLAQELTAAGVNHNGLGLSGRDPATDLEIYTYRPDGSAVDLPAAAAAVIAAHIAPGPVTPPSYGPDAADIDRQAAAAVTALRSFIANGSPTNAEVVANSKLQNRVLLALLRRVGV